MADGGENPVERGGPNEAPVAVIASADDVRTVERLRAGEEAAFTQLIDRHHMSLVRLARTYLHEAMLAEEVVQDTWIALLESLGRFEGRSSLKTWLFRILMNVMRSRLRRESRSVPNAERAKRRRRHHERLLRVPEVGAGCWSPAGRRGTAAGGRTLCGASVSNAVTQSEC